MLRLTSVTRFVPDICTCDADGYCTSPVMMSELVFVYVPPPVPSTAREIFTPAALTSDAGIVVTFAVLGLNGFVNDMDLPHDTVPESVLFDAGASVGVF